MLLIQFLFFMFKVGKYGSELDACSQVTTEYKNDVEEFIKFVVEGADNLNCIRCSCINGIDK